MHHSPFTKAQIIEMNKEQEAEMPKTLKDASAKLKRLLAVTMIDVLGNKPRQSRSQHHGGDDFAAVELHEFLKSTHRLSQLLDMRRPFVGHLQ
jgi:hypothetical protein